MARERASGGDFPRCRPVRGGRVGFEPARRVVLSTGSVLAAAAWLAAAAPAFAQTPGGTTISNRALVSYIGASGRAETALSNQVDVVTAVERSRARLELTRVVAAASSYYEPVGPAACRAANGTTPLDPPTLLGLGPIEADRPQQVVGAAAFHGGEPAFVRLADADQNLDPTRREHVDVTLRVAATGDAETIRLTETADASGVFAGYVPTAAAPASASSCVLETARDALLEADYVDAADPNDRARAEVPLDPVSRVFDALSGEPVDGVAITLIDLASGAPAAPLGDDGVSAFPATVVSGNDVLDAGGAVYRFGPGEFRFPLVRSGDYRLALVAPQGYRAPSERAEQDLQSLPGAPFLLDAGSFGAPFTTAGPVLRLDVPVDPAAGQLFLDKRTVSTTVSVGDFIEYRLTLEHTEGVAAAESVVIEDRLPPGLRYQPGSARVVGTDVRLEPEISGNGRQLAFAIGDLEPDESVTLSYAVSVVPGVAAGEIVNTARAVGARGASNEARATVEIVDDLFRHESFVAGRVVVGACADTLADAEAGLAGARVYLEDGRFAVSDESGRFHFEGLSPGVHVLQLDTDSLPSGVEPEPCSGDVRFAGSAASRFIDLEPGALGRADFYVRATASGGPSVVVEARPAEPAPTPDREATAVEERAADAMPDFDVGVLEPEFAWLWPAIDTAPSIPSIKIAVQHAASETVALSLNGSPVSALNFEGAVTASERGVALSRWRGVDLADGPNVLTATVRDAAGGERRFERTVHFAGPPVRSAIIAERSTLVADGRQRPVVALKFVDRWGQPARRGTVGELDVAPPYRSWLEVERLRENPVLIAQDRAPAYRVGEDGLALVELEPTTRAGRVVLTLRYPNEQTQQLEAWLAPALRDWILVGLAEGTVGYNTLEGNLESAASAGFDADYYDEGRLAFFAKGRVKGSLLTIAFDDEGEDERPLDAFEGTIDPDRYYTVYGDNTEQQFDAPSRERLYVKIERDAFMAMFGDFETGLTVTELGRYSRSFTGLKSERRGERFSYTAFAADSDQAFVKDELRGDGTSGPYRLSGTSILAGSDKVVLEVRDRFQPDRIVSTRPLQRHFDYDVDYVSGTLQFKEPVPSRDFGLNPLYIVVDYETRDGGRRGVLAGGRVAAALGAERAELGLTLIRDGTVGAVGELAATDLRYRFGEATELEAELATSTSESGAGRERGAAYRLELVHQSAVRELEVYLKETDEHFGLGQQTASEQATRRGGVALSNAINDRWLTEAEAFRQENLLDGGVRTVVEGEARYRDARRSASSGLRTIDEKLPTQQNEVTQAFAGGSWRFFDDTLTTRMSLETELSGHGSSADYPERTLLGVDVAVTRAVSLFGEHEIADGELLDAETTRVGVKASPGDRTEIDSSLNEAMTEYGPRTYATLGLTQAWSLGSRWTLDFGGERTRSLREPELEPLDARVPLASGSLGEDFTAGFFGAGYRARDWSLTSRLEYRDGATERHRALIGGFYRERVAGRGFSAELRVLDRRNAERLGGFEGRARVGWAYRPADSRWIILERADWSSRREGLGEDESASRRLINNLNAHWQIDRLNELGLQYAAKYVRHDTGAWAADGFIDLLGVEWRRGLNEKLDVGVHASWYRASSVDVLESGWGVDLGYQVARNLVLAFGYNFAGFEDEDFSQARYTAAGPFASFRLKIDHASLEDLLRR